jgi:hypothetical protein
MASSSRSVSVNVNNSELLQEFVHNVLFESESESELNENDELINVIEESASRDSESDSSSDDEIVDTGNRQITNWDWKQQPNVVKNIPFTGCAGINNIISRRLDDSCTELDVFSTFLSDDFWQMIVRETNVYAASKLNGSVWKEVTVDELKLYISLCILMSQHKKSNLNDYWTKRRVISSPIFSETMPRDRFKLISRYLHFSSENTQSDKMRKIRTVIDYLLHKFQFIFTPDKNICIDESLMAFRGRLPFVQFNLASELDLA